MNEFTEKRTADVQAVMDVLQRVYGDATQTELDARAASAVLTALRDRGWADLQTLGALVASTPDRTITFDPSAIVTDWEIEVRDIPATLSRTVTAREARR